MSSLESRFDDKEHDYLEGPSLDFFDQWLSEDPESLNSSENSNDANLFDDLDLGYSAQDDPFDTSSPFAVPSTTFQPIQSWKQSSHRQESRPLVTKTQKLAYRLKPDGVAISAGDLLAIEGRNLATLATLATPPATPRSGLAHSTATNWQTPSTFSRDLCHRVKISSRFEGSLIPTPSPVFHSMSPEALRRVQRMKRSDQSNLQGPEQSFPLSPPPSGRFPLDEQFRSLSVPSQIYGPESQKLQSISNGTVLPEDVMDSLMLSSARQDAWSNPIDPRLFSNSPPPVDWLAESSGGFDQTFASTSPGWPQLDTSFASIGLGISFGDTTSSPLDDPFADPPFLSSSPAYINSAEVSPRTSRSRFGRSAAPSPSPHESPLDSRRRRSKVSQRRRPASGSKTPRSASGIIALDFVNFTASDNQKILTGVAPSGSSKTKARREREASERRKKLSQAAAKAVREAGGDVEALRKEGLLV